MAREFERTLEDIDSRCRAQQVPYIVIGGIAAIVHGSLRATGDIDLTILAEVENLDKILDLFADEYVSLKPDPLVFFRRYLFVPLQHRTTKVRVDVAAALSGFERLAIERSLRLLFNDVEVSVCTIEDLIVMKLVAARPHDVADLRILVTQHKNTLDTDYLRARAKEFVGIERSVVPKRLEELLRGSLR